MEREQEAGGLDIQELLRNAINLSENEVLDTFHPAVGLVQMLAEVVDPINYARYWYNDDIYWSNVPANILMTEGMSDAIPLLQVLRSSRDGDSIVGEAVSINDAHKIKALAIPIPFKVIVLALMKVYSPVFGSYQKTITISTMKMLAEHTALLSSTLTDNSPAITPRDHHIRSLSSKTNIGQTKSILLIQYIENLSPLKIWGSWMKFSAIPIPNSYNSLRNDKISSPCIGIGTTRWIDNIYEPAPPPPTV